jgi:transcriptional regulator with XRE-family HTH domain
MSKNSELQILGQNIRKVRRGLKLSQEDLADRCDLHRTYICDVERGARNVTFGTLLRLARGLDMPVSELIRTAESATPGRPEAVVVEGNLAAPQVQRPVRRDLDHRDAPMMRP